MRFIAEVKKLNGQEYPPKTLYEIIVCVQMHLESQGIFWKLIDDGDFVNVKFALDNVMKKQTALGFAKPARQVNVISYDDEETL